MMKLIKLLFTGALAGSGLILGVAVGFGFALNLSEEDRRRIKKGFFELKELPRRVMV